MALIEHGFSEGTYTVASKEAYSPGKSNGLSKDRIMIGPSISPRKKCRGCVCDVMDFRVYNIKLFSTFRDFLRFIIMPRSFSILKLTRIHQSQTKISFGMIDTSVNYNSI